MREPAVPGFSVISWRADRSAHFAGLQRAPQWPLVKRLALYTRARELDIPVVVLRRGNGVKVEYDGGPQELRDVLQAVYHDRYEEFSRWPSAYDNAPPGLRVRIQPGVSLQALVNLRDSWLQHQTYRHFDWIIDAGYWPPAGD